MRFLRLDYRDDLRGVDLHPLLSVVTAVGEREIDHLLEAVRRLSTGSTSGLRGLVEHGGLLVELDPVEGEPLQDLTTSATVVVHVDGIDADDGTSGLEREIARWERQAAVDSATVEEIRSHIDLSVTARAHRLRNRLAPTRPAVGNPAMTAGRLRVRAVRRAFDALARLDPVVAEPAPEVEELVERWEAYCRRRNEHEGHLVALAAQVADAERSVSVASEALVAARDANRPVLLAPEREARLEELWVLSNESSLWRKGLNQEEQAEMQALLHSVGVSSWTEYGVLRMSPVVAPIQQAAVQRAENDLDRARRQLERARAERAGDEITRGLHDELAAIKSDCKPLLGVLVPSDIGAALRQQRRMIENPRWVEALNDLRDVLSSNDLHPPGGFEVAEIVGWTDSWLRAQESLHQPGKATLSSEQPGDEQELRIELDRERQALIRHERALSQIDRAERNAARSGLRVQQLRSQLRDRVEQPTPTTAAEIMDMVVPAAEQVLSDLDASVPLAVVGELPDLPPSEIDALMECLEEVAQRVQIVVVTENPAVGEWARRVGLERADLRLGSGGLL